MNKKRNMNSSKKIKIASVAENKVVVKAITRL